MAKNNESANRDMTKNVNKNTNKNTNKNGEKAQNCHKNSADKNTYGSGIESRADY